MRTVPKYKYIRSCDDINLGSPSSIYQFFCSPEKSIPRYHISGIHSVFYLHPAIQNQCVDVLLYLSSVVSQARRRWMPHALCSTCPPEQKNPRRTMRFALCVTL
jgi:hypothetical protein